MLGKRELQPSFFTADCLYLDKVGPKTFNGFLATHSDQILRDEGFSELYCGDLRRPSVPPSTSAVALLVQSYERVTDEEVVNRVTFESRWSLALGTEPCGQRSAKSRFQPFRATLILNEKARGIFERPLSYTRKVDYLKRGKMKVALDSTRNLGKGAVKDADNLFADGMRKLVSRPDACSVKGVSQWLKGRLERTFSSSLKGEAEIDRDDAEARRGFSRRWYQTSRV